MEHHDVGQIESFHMIFPPFLVNFSKAEYLFLMFDRTLDTNDRQLITTAMNQLMFDVGTPVANQSSRQACVFFRPSVASDPEVLKIQYGTGCSATVSNRKRQTLENITPIQVGYWTNYQKTLNLAPRGCFYKGIIQHELTHVLGKKTIISIQSTSLSYQASFMNNHDLIEIHTLQLT